MAVVALLVLGFLIYKVYKGSISTNKHLSDDKIYKEAILQLEGKNFFCYNNKTDVQDAIEIVFIPQLSPGIETIFLNGKKPESDYDEWLISRIMHNFKHYSKFPHLFKIRNGEIIERSINNEFYNMVDQNKPMAEFFKVIDEFFEITTPPDKPASP